MFGLVTANYLPPFQATYLQFCFNRDAGDSSKDGLVVEGLVADLASVVGEFTRRFSSKEVRGEMDDDGRYCGGLVFFFCENKGSQPRNCSLVDQASKNTHFYSKGTEERQK